MTSGTKSRQSQVHTLQRHTAEGEVHPCFTEIHVRTCLNIVAGCRQRLASQTLDQISAPDEQHTTVESKKDNSWGMPALTQAVILQGRHDYLSLCTAPTIV